ncbi:MAG TPA: VOC family protein [Nocardioidaceae bacterium]|nr:VOC family protein [Nocardioidaceae bacterium]
MLRIVVTSVFVEDQNQALAFYTDVLGFVRKTDIPLGEARWITVASAADPDGVELLLEPNGNQVAKAYQEGVKAQGIPVTSFAVDDLNAEYQRLIGLGVEFAQEPMDMGPVRTAVFDDTCGNLIQLAQAT